jgi:hypothetical protein
MVAPQAFAQRSPFADISDVEWTRFVRAMTVQAICAVSDSGGLGCYDLRPRRLVELGLMEKGSLRRVRGSYERQVQVGTFVAPAPGERAMTDERFLGDLDAQHDAFIASVRAHLDDIATGRVQVPAGVSRAGALAILHRGGRAALAAWPELLSHTAALYERAKDCFR